MSAMKPDGWICWLANNDCDDGETGRPVADYKYAKEYSWREPTPLYTLATVRKWLSQPPSKEMLEAVFQLKANDPDKQDLADLMARVVHFDICERMLAAKLRELEDGK